MMLKVLKTNIAALAVALSTIPAVAQELPTLDKIKASNPKPRVPFMRKCGVPIQRSLTNCPSPTLKSESTPHSRFTYTAFRRSRRGKL